MSGVAWLVGSRPALPWLAGVSIVLGLSGCGSGFGLENLADQVKMADTGASGQAGGSGSGSMVDTGLSGGSGSSGSGSSGSGSSGSGSSGSGSSGSGSSGSGSSGSGSSGSGSSGSGSSGSGGSTDADGDGYPSSSDCNDANPSINPGATEVCGDGIDNDCDGGIDNDPACARNIVGGFVILFGYNQFFPGSYNCGLLWNYSGTEDTLACPSCDFAFNISAVYDTSVSFTDGSCTGMTNFNALWAHDSDYYGGTPYFLEYYAGSWMPITAASYNTTTGYWDWGTGLLDEPYGYYYYFAYYYTNYQYSVAYVY